jgi:hypothetical protein
MPQRKYKNRNSKEIKFKKSHHGNNPKKEIPKKPLVLDGPGQSGMKTLTSIE